MRIQHNIAALNSYRNLTTNNSAVSKNLEKLSSGYRINRAGDDAAGLAISEKMRAQITGLKTAQKNANDGISLVQTAEGAMTEIHSMLNRMVELADQSANGTYADEVDRENLQKEIASLKDEINRIADATNFNGINLLDGSMDPGATAASATWSDATELAIGNKDQAHQLATTAVGHALRKDGVDRQEPSFTVDLTNVKFTAAADGKSFKVDIGGTELTIDKKADGTTAFSEGDEISGNDLAKAIANAVNGNDSGVKLDLAAGGQSAANVMGIKIGTLVYTATADGSTVKFALATTDGANTPADLAEQTLPADGTSAIPQNGVKISLAAAADGTLEGLDAGGHANTKINIGVAEKANELAHATFSLAGQIKDGTKLTIGDKTYVFQIGKDSKATAGSGEVAIDMKDVEADDGQLVDKAIAKLTNQENTWFRLESGATGLLTAVEKVGADGKPVYAGKGDITTTAGLKSNFKISQMTYTEATEGDATKGLTLQIGDTSDNFNKLTVAVKDMHTTAMGIGDIDISTQQGASDAVDLIKDAINYVSSTRGDLGAIQNRLEHTINNLSVTTENMTAAESRIRDVDMAEEMMAYTKNNILVQASQAMLAQANQIPQGVLQLLQ